jgi:hypothetical protein
VLTSTVRLLVNAAAIPSIFEAIPVTLETPNPYYNFSLSSQLSVLIGRVLAIYHLSILIGRVLSVWSVILMVDQSSSLLALSVWSVILIQRPTTNPPKSTIV